MKTFRVTAQSLVYSFFRATLDLKYTEDFRGCLYVPDSFAGHQADIEQVAIAVGYNTFIGNTCFMHTVIQKPEFMSKDIIRQAFGFPFIDCKVKHVLAPVEASNTEALEFNERLGFERILTLKDGANDGDLVVLQMTRENCRWLEKKHG